MSRSPGLPSMSSSRPIWPLDILVVDDDRNMRRVLRQALEVQGHGCRDTAHGAEALQALELARADLILSDWGVPGGAGHELCLCTRGADGTGPYTYFIAMTGSDQQARLMAAMEAGADDFIRKPIDLDELNARLVLASRLIALQRRHRSETAQLQTDSQRLLIASHTDALTGVGNRGALAVELDLLFAERERYERRVSLAICDVDFFKRYNDTYGHVAGDEALRRVTRTIRASIRTSDRVYRFGGEEFVVLLPEQALEEAVYVLERVRSQVEVVVAMPDPIARGAKLTLSAGVAELDASDRKPDDWIGRADKALYEAKVGGRNRVCSAPPTEPNARVT